MLESLFEPKIIAVVGASRTPGKVGYFMLENLVEGGFEGTIIPVNPFAEKILGLPCVGSLSQIKEPIDFALIVVPQPEVKKAVREAIDAGAKAVAIISGGFKEASEAGAELEKQIAGMCRLRNVRLLGPNCLGLINTDNKMNAFYAVRMPRKGGISMISQSSAVCSAFLDRLPGDQLGVSKVINIGNKADLSEVDFLRVLADDKKTDVIIGYLESISDGDAFVKAAEDASANKPVIILKSATTISGRNAVAAHSGEILGTDTAYGAAFKRAGVVRADSFGSLLDFASAFSLQPLPKGKRVLVITNAGGPGIMAVDAIERNGLTVTYMLTETIDSLRAKMPDAVTFYNPVDILGGAKPEHYKLAIEAALADDNIDAIVVVFVDRITSDPVATAQAILSCNNIGKPILASFIGGQNDAARQIMRPGGIPEFDSPESAVAALKAMWEYVAWKQRPPRIVTRFKVHRRRVERIITRRLRSERLHISEVKAKDILKAYDFNIPKGYLATSAEEAVEIAERIGFPVAMKIVSPEIGHKTDFGGVKLNMANRQSVRDNYDLMMMRVRQKSPKAVVDGIYLEKMLDRGLEVILGFNRDPQFGPMLMFGLGGIYVEVLEDVAFYLAPITFDEAMQMLVSSKSYQILVGARGEESVDIHMIAKCLQKISQLSTDFPQIADLEINPLIVGEIGTEPYVADARINLRHLDVQK
nr:acetate--CoA ligase family protein [Desulfobulbaceae bacterium]